MASLPTLDFSKFTRGSHLDQLKLGKSLVESFKDHGFVKLVNHGLGDLTTEALLEFVRQILTSTSICLGKHFPSH